MRMPGSATQSKNKFGRKRTIDVSHLLTPVTSPRTGTEGARTPNNPTSSSASTNSAGFLLLDTSLRLLYVNQEAVSALTYSTNLSKENGSEGLLESQVQGLFEGANGSRKLKGNGSLVSGRRCYQLRVFSIRPLLANGLKPAVALLLERSKKANVDLSRLPGRFRLTQREVETVDHLVHGLNTQQIAERMGISPNTVKAFLRSIMMKMATDSRAGIIAKILQA